MDWASLNLSSEIIDSIDNKGEKDQDSAKDDTDNDDTCEISPLSGSQQTVDSERKRDLGLFNDVLEGFEENDKEHYE